MRHKTFVLCSATALLALAVACSKSPQTPASPSSVQEGTGAAAADGSTLKVPAPPTISPVNNAQPDQVQLVAGKVTGKFDASVNPSYEFEIKTNAGATIAGCAATVGAGSGSNVTYTPTCSLDFDTIYKWRVRAVYAGAVGPWSAEATFRSPVGGYLRGNELFDPLTKGPSAIVTSSNDVTYLPGVGVRLNTRDSYVEWALPQPCADCEFSAMMTNIGNGSEEWKTKVMSMLRGDGVDTTLNAYRVTIDKRSTWLGQGSRIRYTMRSRGVDAGEPAGGGQNWSRSRNYFWHFEWRNGQSRLKVFEDGRNGRLMENLGVSYRAPYNPNPHLIRLGSVGGRAENETNPGTIVWNVWVSPSARPNLPGDK
jgi:hypothetical protein